MGAFAGGEGVKGPGVPERWALVIEYDWGGAAPWGSVYRFNETWRCSIFNHERTQELDRGKLHEEIQRFLEQMVRRHAFDCGQHLKPMLPRARSVEITPIYSHERFYLDGEWERETDLLICEELVRLLDARLAPQRARLAEEREVKG